MTPRRTSGRRPGTSDWRHAERRTELLKAIGAAGGVVALTALIIFFIKPGDSSTSTQTPIPQTSVTTIPAGLPDSSTPPDTSTPGGSTPAP